MSVFRDELERSWHEHVRRAADSLFGGWRSDVERTVLASRRDFVDRLVQFTRRMRSSRTRREWTSALLEGVAVYAPRAAVFSVEAGDLILEKAHGIEFKAASASLAAAPAYAHAVESGEVVVAAPTEGELSAGFAVSGDSKVYLFPVISRLRVVAILYAEPAGAPEAPGTLELIAAIAGAMHETLRTANWASLPKAERELHLRAQRFARVHVAEMLHRKSGAVEEGRASRNIYEALREEIEAARGHFRESFIDPADSMVDYLHLEIVRTLAFDDLALLGSSYPGPLA